MQCAIVGVGETEYVRGSGKSNLVLAAECSVRAIRDAGLTPADIDGLILFWDANPVASRIIADNLGMALDWQLDIHGGGENGPGVIATAAAAIEAGLCSTVLCLHAANRFSSKPQRSEGPNFSYPFGMTIAVQTSALVAQRHMHEYGTTSEQLGEIAVAFREHASLNPHAVMQKPFTLEEYLASRMISTPLRLFDCCLETDAGAACVVTSLERARDLPHKPVQILAGVCNASGIADHEAHDGAIYTSMGSRRAAPLIWERAGVGPQDVDLVQLYDAFTIVVLTQLEDYGFCGKGEGGAFVEKGRLRLGGELPANTSGGQLSEGYVKSMNLVNEGVRQLRGVYAGTERQVRDAKIALVTGSVPSPMPGSALLLAGV